ncbi:MAG: hypothetical protein IJT29_04720, partial [Oscillospiraceae bacterium]|nr:hypothetical protein [Oscillospiraceae bacterium]
RRGAAGQNDPGDLLGHGEPPLPYSYLSEASGILFYHLRRRFSTKKHGSADNFRLFAQRRAGASFPFVREIWGSVLHIDGAGSPAREKNTEKSPKVGNPCQKSREKSGPRQDNS